MKYLFMIVLATIALISYANGGEQEKYLFILSGQSNMESLNPNTSFTPAVEAEFGKDNVIVVKDAHGGRTIGGWYKPAKGDKPGASGMLYGRLMTKVNAAIKGKKVKAVTFIWMQGEADAMKRYGQMVDYATSLKGLLNQLGKDLGRNDINFVIGRISDFGMNNERYPHWMMVRKVQVEFAEASPRGVWVDTDELNDGVNKEGKEIKNSLHCSVDGSRILGKRFAEKAIELIKR